VFGNGKSELLNLLSSKYSKDMNITIGDVSFGEYILIDKK
jgi:hypothetical protein